MLRSTTAQEALVAELLGDMRELIERAESFEATMDRARDAMGTAVGILDSRIEPFRHALAAEIEQTQTRAIRSFIHQTNAIAQNEQKRQTEAMADAARTVVANEVVQPLRQFAELLQGIIKENRRPWEVWSVHAATAIISALISGSLVLHFFGR